MVRKKEGSKDRENDARKKERKEPEINDIHFRGQKEHPNKTIQDGRISFKAERKYIRPLHFQRKTIKQAGKKTDWQEKR